MKKAYVYVLDTMADWELGYVAAELNSARYFKKAANRVPVKTVSYSNAPITTQGGMTIVPNTTVDEVNWETSAILILPGADTWQDSNHAPIIEKATMLLNEDANVAAICGATGALARADLLNSRSHTSNALEYLKMVAPNYKGEAFYQNARSVADGNLITGSSAGSLLFTRNILARLDVFAPDTLDAWYEYFNTGDALYFSEMMKTLPDRRE